MRWAVHVARMVARRDVSRVWVGKPKGKRPPGKHRRRSEDNIATYLHEVGYEGLDRLGSGKGQVVDTYECGNEPSGSIK